MHEAVALGSAIRSLAFNPIYGWNHKFIFSFTDFRIGFAGWRNLGEHTVVVCMKYRRRRAEF